jgi:hypothetical protein
MAKKRKKTSRKAKRKSKRGVDLTKRALKLIEQAAVLMKQGVIIGAKRGAKGKATLKRRAYSLADVAVRQLHVAVKRGGKVIRKGIKKI